MDTSQNGLDASAESGSYEAPIWPPPGLHTLAGAMATPIRRATLGSALIVLPMLWWLTAATDVTGRSIVAATAIVVLAGLVFYLGGLIRVAGIADTARRARALGYDGVTLARVIADTRGEVGWLLAGQEPYDLPEDVRSGMLQGVVRRASLTLAAALLPPPCLAIALVLAWRGELAQPVLWLIVLAPAALCALAAAAVAAQNALIAQWARSSDAWDPLPVTERDRAQAWLARWAPGTNARPARMAPLVLSALLVVFGFVAITVILGFGMILIGRTMVAREGMAHVESMGGVHRAELYRPYALPSDSSVDPLQAALAAKAAFQLVASREGGQTVPGSAPWLPALQRRGAWPDSLWLVAMGRSNPPLRDSLRAAALTHPADSLIAFAARAPSLALVDAMSNDSMTGVFDIAGIVRGNILDAGHARLVRAGLLLGDGRTAEAERTLRESITFGLLIRDHSPSMRDAYLASTLVTLSGDGLSRLYEETGRDREAADIRRAAAVVQRMASAQVQPADALDEEELASMVRDRSLLPALRWNALRAHTLLQRCGNLPSALFGRSAHAPLSTTPEQADAVSPAELQLFRALTQPPAMQAIDFVRWRTLRNALLAILGPPTEANFCAWAILSF